MRPGSLLFLGGLVAAVEDLLFHEDYAGWEDSVASSSLYNYTWTYNVVTDAVWQSMSVNDFKQYKAIIIGDPIESDPSYLDELMPNRKTWGAAVEGNVIIIGTDTSNHYGNAQDLMSNGIAFAATGKGTGLYFSLSKYYGGLNETNVPVLDIFGNFSVRGDLNTDSSDECYDDVHIVARNQVLNGITDYSLSNWSCSVHEAFVNFPSTGSQSFVPLAIAQDVPGDGSRKFSDGTSGIPYIIVRGEVSPVGCGNGRIDPGEECDGGSGCNAQCRFSGPAKSKAGPIAGGVVGTVAAVAALGTLGFLAVTKTALGAKAAAAVGIGASGGAGGGAGGGSGAAGAAGAMYVPTGIEGKAAAAAGMYVPTGVEGKAAAAASHGAGHAVHAAHGAAQATQGLSAAVPPGDGGATSALSSGAVPPPVDPTSAAGAATAMAPPAPPPVYVPGAETAMTQAPGATAGAGFASAAPGAAGAGAGGAGMAPGLASAGGAGFAPGAASAGGLATASGTTGGGLTVGQTVGTSLAAGAAGFVAGIGGLLGRKKKNKEVSPDAEAMPLPPMAPNQQQQVFYSETSAPQQYYPPVSPPQQYYPPVPPPQQYYPPVSPPPQQYYSPVSPQPQGYYPPPPQESLYAPTPAPVSPPVAPYDEKEIKTGETSNTAYLNVGVQEVVPTPSHEVQGDPISRAEMPVSEQPYIPPPPPSNLGGKEYQ
ncbi:hypothetical protein TWF694_007733 [Orbilia ellipsospora]|uniref:Uncharacterized protein n=1 Tax=Orbilia ellipsospora TaxID=2528407 RepID=A0AAV9XIL0_9PEZI